MSTNAGQLLWNRMMIALAGGETVDIDTGLKQANRSFRSSSENEPGLGDGFTVSRVQVIPMMPISGWLDISHGEPYLDSTTGTVHVSFTNRGGESVSFNALFWDPHTSIGPGEVDLYNPLAPT